jgi:hypothetical protein
MLVKFGKIWVNPERIDSIIPPFPPSGAEELVTHKFYQIAVIMRDVGKMGIWACDTYAEALKLCDEYAEIVNNHYQPGYPDADPANA